MIFVFFYETSVRRADSHIFMTMKLIENLNVNFLTAETVF